MSRPSAKILDYVTRPRNAGEIVGADAIGRASLDGQAPFVTIFLKLDGVQIARATFQTFGCGYSIACCSALTELLTGQTLGAASRITPQAVLDVFEHVPEEKRFCAALAVKALQQALEYASSSREQR